MSYRKEHEDFGISCRFLAQEIWKSKKPDYVPMLMEDLATKVYMHEASCQESRIIVDPPIDIGIFTVTERELLSLKIVLGIDNTTRPDDNINGIQVWKTRIKGTASRPEMTAVLVFMAEQLNIASSVICTRILGLFRPRTAALVGVAAGVKGRVNLIDVIAAADVIYYEPESTHEEGSGRRQVPFYTTPFMRRLLNGFSPDMKQLDKEFRRLADQLDVKARTAIVKKRFVPEIHNALILSGEKLIRDGNLPAFAKEYHDKAYGAEEEGAGFCKACAEYGIPWLVFRGVSDFGDKNKNKNKDEVFQPLAAIMAAVVALGFIKSALVIPTDTIRF